MRNNKDWFSVRCWAVILTMIATSIACSAYGQNTAYYTDANKNYKKGFQLLRNGLYGPAQKAFAESAELTSDLENYQPTLLQIKSELMAAHCAMLLGKPDAEGKLEDYIQVHRPDPLVNIALLEIGDHYFTEKDYTNAIKYYEFIELGELDQLRASEVGFKAGYSHFVRKSFANAIEYLGPVAEYKNEFYFPVNYYLGLCYYYEDEYDLAADYLERVTISKTYKPYIPHLLTQIYFNLGNYDEVILKGERALQLDELENRAEIRGLLGRVYFKERQYDKALPHLEAYVSEAKDPSPEDRYQLAYIYYANERYKEAEELFKTLNLKDGQLGQNSHFYLGVSLYRQGKTEDARNAFAIAKRIDYDPVISLESQFLYGVMSADLGYDREAVNALIDIPTTAKYFKDAQKTLAWVFNQTEDLDNAIDILQDYELTSPELKQAYQRVTFLKGLQHYQANEANSAAQLWEISLQYPIDPFIQLQTLFWQGNLEYLKGNYRESIDLYNRYFTLYDPAFPLKDAQREYVARYNQGYNYLRLEDYALASGQFQEAVSTIKEQYADIMDPYVRQQILSDALIRTGDCLFKRNIYDRALRYYDEAITDERAGFDYALYQSGIIYGLKGQPFEKIVRLERVAEMRSTSAYSDDALYELGSTYIELNQSVEAVQPLEQIIEQYGANSEFTIQALFKLGLVNYNAGDSRKALEYYKQIFKYEASARERRDALAAIEEIYLTDLDDPEAYLSYLDESGNSDLSSMQRDSITFKPAINNYLEAEYPEAIAAFTNYLDKFPNGIYQIEAHYKRAESHAVLKAYDAAFNDYEKVVELGESNYFTRAAEKAAKIAYNVLEDFDAATNLYSIWGEKAESPETVLESNLGLMRSAFKTSQFDLSKDAAAIVIEHSMATEQDKQTAAFYLGKSAYLLKDFESAVPYLNISTKNKGSVEAAEARYLIADIYYTQQEFALASEMARLAVQENSSYPYWVARSLILLSDVAVATGDILQARAALEAIIENFESDESIIKMAQSRLGRIKTEEKKNNPDSLELLELDDQDDQ